MYKNKQPDLSKNPLEGGEVAVEELPWTIDLLLTQKTNRRESEPNKPEQPNMLIGECLDTHHPTLLGRVLVRWKTQEGQPQQCWLPTLQGLSIRTEDRVLLAKAANWDECIVTGVIDGFAKRKAPPRDLTAILNLMGDEHICIQGVQGTKLVEIFQSNTGPVIRILQPDANIEVPGKLSIRAEQIELQAVQGSVHVEASDDVMIKGEFVKLN